ncbi:FimV/HubP family polar landmark protein [Shewanella acanthi]|uniref:FimV/HubP family polar landmark protein n=1 Tax=Shewanella acanthi TaxID=2864212 RepID=UPI001C656627|nr:FimV/HubP family polar landmark protein [Shewanella acanthi]QYJ80018.1 pilus assembly protein FimV [Shewanella acanthi]
MKFRTSYLVGLVASALAVSSTTYFIDPAVAADTPPVKPLKIMGPDGQIRQVNHQYGPTTSRDTFWSIAQKVRPDSSVSVYQVMAAVFDANPHAFNSDNYNSLEKGMILLIPPKEVMLAIPNGEAIARAERSDRLAKSGAKSTSKQTKPAPKATQPKTEPVSTPVITNVQPQTEPKSQTDVKPQPTTVAPITAAETTKAEPKMLSSDLTARLEAAESKILSLTDELARTQDQLSVRNTDVEALKAKVEELNQQIAVLEETLQASKKQNLALKAEVEAAQQTPNTVDEPAEAMQEMPAEADDLWRTLVNNPMLLSLAAVIPALLLLALVFVMLRRRRNKARKQLEVQSKTMAATAASGAAVTAASVNAMEEDHFGDMAVHLDTDHADSIDSLLDVSSVDLAPEIDMSDNANSLDIPEEMFASQGVAEEPQFTEDEGQSLDDLWAEAMGDQEAAQEEKIDPSNILAEEDLDALLAGLETDEPSPEESDVQLSEPDDSANDAEDETVETEAEEDLGAAIAAELDEELGSDNDDVDDIDALLASFDTPTVTETTVAQTESDPVAAPSADDLADEIAAELDGEFDEMGVADNDDIDALLAGFDSPVAKVAEPEAVTPEEASVVASVFDTALSEDDVSEEALLATQATQDEDLEALLAGFNTEAAIAEPIVEESTPAIEFDKKPSLQDEIAAELESAIPEDITEDASDEDTSLDSLLAEFDLPEQAVAEDDDFNFDMETAQAAAVGAARQVDDSDEEIIPFKEKESSFFNDLKSSKAKDSNVLDWDGDLGMTPEAQSKDPEVVYTKKKAPVEDLTSDLGNDFAKGLNFTTDDDLGAVVDLNTDVELSDDNVLAAFAAHESIEEEILTPEDSFALDDEHTLTVDEALAALDAKESRKPKKFTSDNDLSSFQDENGFIDIEKLLSDADQDATESDLYPEVDVEMSDVGALIGDAAMIDVDDEENSVNAKLDLARAYIEIEDKDSAKALLKEVQIDGNDRQQDEAGRLLKELG